MVRSLITYRHIKDLCSFFRRTSNTFRVDDDTVAVVSGIFSGLIFEFSRDFCRVKTTCQHTCLELPLDFSADHLVNILVNHNVIRMCDVATYD